MLSRLLCLDATPSGVHLDEARSNIAEAIGLHLAAMKEDGEEIPIEKEPMLVTRLSVPPAA